LRAHDKNLTTENTEKAQRAKRKGFGDEPEGLFSAHSRSLSCIHTSCRGSGVARVRGFGDVAPPSVTNRRLMILMAVQSRRAGLCNVLRSPFSRLFQQMAEIPVAALLSKPLKRLQILCFLYPTATCPPKCFLYIGGKLWVFLVFLFSSPARRAL